MTNNYKPNKNTPQEKTTADLAARRYCSHAKPWLNMTNGKNP